MDLSTLMPFAFALGIPAMLMLYSIYTWNPGWHAQVAEKTNGKFTWRSLNRLAGVVSAALALISAGLLEYGNVQDISSATLITAIATISYVLVQSLVTDTKLRLADRGTLRLATVFAFGMTLTYYLYNHQIIPQFEMYAWLIAMACAMLLIYMPGFGSSDARAISLAVAGSVPIVGILGIAFSMIFYALSAVIFIVWVVMKYKVSSIMYVNHISIPAVPFLLFPFLVVTLYAPLEMAFGLGWAEWWLGWIPEIIGGMVDRSVEMFS